MLDLNVYKIASAFIVSEYPTFLVMEKDESQARASAIAGINSRFASLNPRYKMNGHGMMDDFYLRSDNAICQKLKEGVDYILLHTTSENQINIDIGGREYTLIKSSIESCPNPCVLL